MELPFTAWSAHSTLWICGKCVRGARVAPRFHNGRGAPWPKGSRRAPSLQSVHTGGGAGGGRKGARGADMAQLLAGPPLRASHLAGGAGGLLRSGGAPHAHLAGGAQGRALALELACLVRPSPTLTRMTLRLCVLVQGHGAPRRTHLTAGNGGPPPSPATIPELRKLSWIAGGDTGPTKDDRKQVQQQKCVAHLVFVFVFVLGQRGRCCCCCCLVAHLTDPGPSGCHIGPPLQWCG